MNFALPMNIKLHEFSLLLQTTESEYDKVCALAIYMCVLVHKVVYLSFVYLEEFGLWEPLLVRMFTVQVNTDVIN